MADGHNFSVQQITRADLNPLRSVTNEPISDLDQEVVTSLH